MNLLHNFKKILTTPITPPSNDESSTTEKQTPTSQSLHKKLLKIGVGVLLAVIWNGVLLNIDSFKEDLPFDIENFLPITFLLSTGFGIGLSILLSSLGIRNEKRWAFSLGRVSITLLGVLITVLIFTMFYAVAYTFAAFGSSLFSSILFGVLFIVFGIACTLQFIMPLYLVYQELSKVESGKSVPENCMGKFLERIRKNGDDKRQAQALETLTWKPFIVTILCITVLSLALGPIMWGYNSLIATFDSRIKTVNEYTPIEVDDAPQTWHTVKVTESENRIKEVYYCWTGDITSLYYIDKKVTYQSTSFGSSMILSITGIAGFILLILSRLGFNSLKVGFVLFMSTIGGGMASMIVLSFLRIMLGSGFSGLP